jgi:drug/metabolite transporter (DMT)-like permease
MAWQFLILASVFLYSVSVLLQRILLKEERSDPKAYSVFFQLLTGFLIGGFGVLFKDVTFPNLRPLLLNLFLMALLYGFGNVFIFEALKTLEASRFTIIFASRALFTILASSLFLKEGLLPLQLLGTFLILLGVVLVNIESARLTFSRRELIAFFAAASFGLANTNDRFLLQEFKSYPYMFLVFIVPAILIVLLYPRTVKKMVVFLESGVLVKMLLLCVVYAASAITFFSALQIARNSSQVVSINLTSVIVTVLLAIAFLKERKHLPQKLLGSLASFVGLLLVS